MMSDREREYRDMLKNAAHTVWFALLVIYTCLVHIVMWGVDRVMYAAMATNIALELHLLKITEKTHNSTQEAADD